MAANWSYWRHDTSGCEVACLSQAMAFELITAKCVESGKPMPMFNEIERGRRLVDQEVVKLLRYSNRTQRVWQRKETELTP